MNKMMFTIPDTCQKCGAPHFNIVGSIYNAVLNYTRLTVRCMRCGYKQFEKKQPNTIV